MKLQLFSKLTAKPRGRKVVRASARAAHGDEDYYETEPNMKLSHAFMVVLVLHIVAVGGIYAFNQLNASRSGPAVNDRLALSAQPKKAPAPQPEVVQRQPGDADEPLPTVSANPDAPQPRLSADAISPAPLAAAPKPAAPAAPAMKSPGPVVESKPPAPKAAASSTATAPESYTVAKGDNPYKIAKKLGVSYQALLDANKIEDPTKLQIGTVLKIPAKKK